MCPKLLAKAEVSDGLKQWLHSQVKDVSETSFFYVGLKLKSELTAASRRTETKKLSFHIRSSFSYFRNFSTYLCLTNVCSDSLFLLPVSYEFTQRVLGKLQYNAAEFKDQCLSPFGLNKKNDFIRHVH